MAASSQKVWLAGIDGCRGGWIAVFLRPDGDEFFVETHANIGGIVDSAYQPRIVAVDMPIGLPERTGIGGRAAENAIRPLLGSRQSSVFSVPSRAAIDAPDYAAACVAALKTSDPPRKVSKQLFNIAPKIREIDGLLRARPELHTRLFEVHPELAFWRLNGETALTEPKKIKGRLHGKGLALRNSLLAKAGMPEALLKSAPPAPAKLDDLLDACACAAIAKRIHAGKAAPFPNPPPRDAHGLPMAIWA